MGKLNLFTSLKNLLKKTPLDHTPTHPCKFLIMDIYFIMQKQIVEKNSKKSLQCKRDRIAHFLHGPLKHLT